MIQKYVEDNQKETEGEEEFMFNCSPKILPSVKTMVEETTTNLADPSSKPPLPEFENGRMDLHALSLLYPLGLLKTQPSQPHLTPL